jgi:hypothetical protein
MIHVHVLLKWHLILHHNALELIHIVCIIHINLRGNRHLCSIHYSHASHHFVHRNLGWRCWVSQFMISMGIRALVHVSALSMKVKMSAFHCFVVLGNRILILYYQLVFILISDLIIHIILILVKIDISLHFASCLSLFSWSVILRCFFSSIHLPLFLFIILLIFILFQLDSKFFGFLNVELKIKSFLL